MIETPEGILLVQNRRRDGSHDWSTPGGVIEVEEGESMLDGLAREVFEETGIAVSAWAGPLYSVEVRAADLGWFLRVEAWRATAFSGEVTLADPDGIVVDARYVAHGECTAHLVGNARWVVEPFAEWLHEAFAEPRAFVYELAGTERASMVVTRL